MKAAISRGSLGDNAAVAFALGFALLVPPSAATAAPCTQLTCSANITTTASPDQCAAMVTYSGPTPTGDCEIVQTSGLPSGVLYAVGFTVNAFQDKNNPAIKCSFTVTVNDTTPPDITCPPSQTQHTGPAVATYPPPEVSDNCGAPPADCTPPAGSQFPLGTTKVDCSTTDGSGNVSVCAFNVQVGPPLAPAVGPLGLVALAASLAALGAWSARRRHN